MSGFPVDVTGSNSGQILFNGSYFNTEEPIWLSAYNVPVLVNPQVSTLTVNAYPTGNILLTSVNSNSQEYNAPLIFQRPPTDINEPAESLIMSLSHQVPTKPVDGQYITAAKDSSTVYDDLAVSGIQIFGDQILGSPCQGYIGAGPVPGIMKLHAATAVEVDVLDVSTLNVVNVVSSTTSVANNYTATVYISTPTLYVSTIQGFPTGGGNIIISEISTNTLSTGTISTLSLYSQNITCSTLTASTSIRTLALSTGTLQVSTISGFDINASTFSSIIGNVQFSITSTLEFKPSLGLSSINLGLGNVIQGLLGGAATQGLGVVLGGAALATGTVALFTGRQSGGVDSNIFQTVNGSTQLQFSTVNAVTSNIFATTNSPNPLTTPGSTIYTSTIVPAGTYCVRSVGDPLNITNNASTIQMFGQWVPVFQSPATIPNLSTTNINLSSINGQPYTPGGGGGGSIPSTLQASTITVNGNLTNIGTGTLSWSGATFTNTQNTFTNPVAVNNTLTTTGGVFLNAGATVNSGLNVASGGATIQSGMNVASGNLSVSNNIFCFGQVQASGLIQGTGGMNILNGITITTGNLTMTNGASVATLTNLNVTQTARANAVSTNQISTANVNLSSINGAAYPPGGGGGIPSTLNASTINVNGGQTITNGGLVVNGGNVTIQNQTQMNNDLTVVGQTFAVGGLVVQAPGAIFNGPVGATNTLQVSGLTTLNGGVRASFLSTTTISTANVSLSSINGAAYPPTSFSIPSTLNVSTLNANGGIDITNGRLKVTNGLLEVLNGPLLVIAGGVNRIDGELNVTNGLVRTAQVSTSIMSTAITTASTIGTFTLSTISASALTCVVGGGTGGNLGLVYTDSGTQYGYTRSTGASITTFLDPSSVGWNIQNGYTYGTNTIMRCFGNNSASPGTAQFFSTLTVCNNPPTNPVEANIQTYNPAGPNPPTGTVISKAVSTLAITASTINGVPIPSGLGVPTGSITIWAGGSDSASAQSFNVPNGWLTCDGSLFLNSLFSSLAGVLGNKYDYPGIVTPPGQTRLPDLTYAVPMGTPYRNVNNNLVPTLAQITLQVLSWESQYNTTSLNPSAPGSQVSTLSTWKIFSKSGPVLNYGTLFPGTAVSVTGSPGVVFPDMYISSIIAYPGGPSDQGYILMKSRDGVTPIPRVPNTSTIIAIGQGAVSATPGSIVPYKLGTPGDIGVATTYRNQLGIEVGSHQHNGAADRQSSAVPGFNFSIGNANPIGPPFTPTVSTLGAGQNIATPKAPNFLNMVYIIRT